jgi:D-tyrosyl-tRNA(Tyr) deacylase
VSVDGHEVGRTGKGLVVLLGISKEDGEEDARYLVERIINLRIFPDEDNRFNRSAKDSLAELLVISQFTLYADTRRGRRPDFTQAAPPEDAERLYRRAVELFAESGLRVETGRFREYMLVDIQNDGPVTIMIDSDDRFRPRRG